MLVQTDINRNFRMIVEDFIKKNVVFAVVEKLKPESYRKFIERMTITICKEHAPKTRWNISKNEVRDTFTEILAGFRKDITLRTSEDNFYVYKTAFNEHRMVCAKTKKEAVKLASLRSFSTDIIGAKNSVTKVIGMREGSVVTEKNETIPLDIYLHTINISDVSTF